MIYQIFILIDQFTQFPSRAKDGYPNSVKSHLIIQFLVLKLKKKKKKKKTETLFFSEKKISLLTCKIFFQYRVIINRDFIMPPCHTSIYSCSLIRLNATLQNEGIFVCDVIEAQWMHWSDLYFDKLCLIYFTKGWNKFYFKSLFTSARILNVLGDRLELLPSVYPH